ncbi:CocE/NonD family hydrolase [Nocardia sp. NPDC059240]|uniref:CocE/NonD family hydrolase n=1 Tax=Nocardia sp. NPDC059240 TaxID=3346786 RepID=UPI00369BEA12
MAQSNSGPFRLLTPEQEADALAFVNDLLTGDATGVSTYLTSDVEAVRSQSQRREVKIPGHQGVQLDALIAWPETDGPHPLIVMPAGLDKSGWKMYGGAVTQLLKRGYAVVAYTERGLPGSDDEKDENACLTVAGPEDVADGYAVIEWALGHSELHADRDRVGMMGISYGSGISQLVANAHQDVKVVVALSTWADLGESLYDHGTRHIAAAEALAKVSDRPSPELEKVLELFRANTDIEQVLAYAAQRSPAKVPDDRRRSVPTFFTSFWHETIFPQNQLLDYFQDYPGPKRLDLAVGDHSSVEVLGLTTGLYTRTTEAAYDWLDHFLLDIDNGIDRDGVVHTESMHSFTMTASPDLATWSKSARRYYFRAPETGSADGILTVEQPPAQSQSFQAGAQEVKVANTIIFDGLAERLRLPIYQSLKRVDRTRAAVWTTPRVFLAPHHIAGRPEVNVTVTPSGRNATVIAYLFVLEPFTGLMRIVTHAAATITGQESGRPSTLRIPLQATDYRVPALHKLVVVIDTVDQFYSDETEPGAIITLSTTVSSGYLDLPIAP